MKILILFFVMTFFIISASACDDNCNQVSNLEDIQELRTFLVLDTTDQNEFKPYYTCGHYTRDLVKSAELHNIHLGGALVSNHPLFRTENDFEAHIVNYIYINDKIVFIDPQTDKLTSLMGIFFEWEYIRLYHEGIQTPSNWHYNLAPTMKWENS